jgi:dienelactone hydrolase
VFIYLGLLGALFAAAGYVARARRNVLILSLLAAEVVYLISGWFTYSTPFWHVTGLWLIINAVLLGYLGWQWFKKNLSRPVLIKIAAFTGAGAALTVTAIYGAGLFFLMQLPCRVRPLQPGGAIQGVVVTPRHQPPRGVIIYFYEKGGSVLDEGKHTLRPLAEKGFTVLCAEYRAGGRDGLADAKALLTWALAQEQWRRLTVSVMGHGFGGRVALLASCGPTNDRFKTVVAISADAEWPFPDLAPVEHIAELRAPLLIIHGKKDTTVRPEQAALLCQAAQQHHKNARLLWFDAGHYFDDQQWTLILAEVARFCSN